MNSQNDNEEAVSADDDLLERLREWERLSREKHSQWKKDAKAWFDLVAGEQWAPEDKAALLDELRAPITFNRVGPMVDSVCGAEILNRQAVTFYPREVGDAKVSELITGAADWVRDSCDAEDHESDAFSDVIVCGMGWTETFLDYEDNAEGDIRIPRIDPLEMGWDPAAKERNLSDSRYRYRVRSFDKDAFKAKYDQDMLDRVISARSDADADEAAFSTDIARDEYTNPDRRTGGPTNRVIVVQMQWWDLEDGFAVQDPSTGNVETLDPQKYQALVVGALSAGMEPPQAAKTKKKTYYQCLYSGNVQVTPKQVLPCGSFTLKAITGKRDRNKGTWYGIVRAMVDPQMWANKWLSQLLHIINSNAKGGLIYETGAFVNQAKAEREWAKPNGMTEVQPGVLTGNRIMPKQPAQIPASLKDLMAFAVESLPQVSGINLEMLGLVQKEQAGVLEAQRKRAGYAILAVFFDSLRKYRKEQGRVLLDFINRYISDGRLIRISGESGAQYVPLFRQPGVSRYDVVVDEAPMSANQKDMVWGMLMQMMPMLKDAPIGPDIWGKILEYSPLPSSLTSQVSKALTEPKPPSPQDQLQIEDLQATVEQKRSAAVLNYAKAGQAPPGQEQQQPETQGDMMQAHAAMVKDHAAAALHMAKARKTELETAILPFEAQNKARADMMRAQKPLTANDRSDAAGGAIPRRRGPVPAYG